MTLDEFILDWNQQNNNRFTFSAVKIPVSGRPANIEIRFSAVRYRNSISTETWNHLFSLVEAKSHHTMYIVTDEFLFERGIISIAVGSSNYNYQERFVVGVLSWIGEIVFGISFHANCVNTNENLSQSLTNC